MERHLDYVARNVLEEIARDATISLYLHVPFCRAICHYCGCHTKAARRDEPIIAYAKRRHMSEEEVVFFPAARAGLTEEDWDDITAMSQAAVDPLLDKAKVGFAFIRDAM